MSTRETERAQGRSQEDFERRLAARHRRKLRAIRQGDRSVWFGFGMFGLVGWSVAVPALLFTALGAWLDRTRPAGFSWALTLLVIGVTLGCLNAWRWVSRERKVIEEDREDFAEDGKTPKTGRDGRQSP